MIIVYYYFFLSAFDCLTHRYSPRDALLDSVQRVRIHSIKEGMHDDEHWWWW
jgi:hypothetical protein